MLDFYTAELDKALQVMGGQVTDPDWGPYVQGIVGALGLALRHEDLASILHILRACYAQQKHSSDGRLVLLVGERARLVRNAAACMCILGGEPADDADSNPFRSAAHTILHFVSYCVAYEVTPALRRVAIIAVTSVLTDDSPAERAAAPN